MNILIACDSFKDALPAYNVCRAIQKGIEMGLPKAKCRIFPLADGGEGLIDVLTYHLGLEQVAVEVCDPLFRKTKAHYNINRNTGIAFIEWPRRPDYSCCRLPSEIRCLLLLMAWAS
ncbi:MAG: glycerate kinase [Saprospiraceae bacterium]|nr:glycerate kinase [Saprospiraceae bacterium]